jgi:hypothetical protein
MVRALINWRGSTASVLAGLACLTIATPPTRANPYGSPGELNDAQSGGGGLGQSASISADGSVAVVGEPNYNGGAGSALVYANTDGAWNVVQRLTPTGESGAGHFGAAVSIEPSGQTLVVGAPDNNGGVGSAWAFALSNGSWEQQGQLLGGAGETGAGKFGASVAVASSGYMAMVGAPMSDAGKGQVFTFYYEQGSGWYLFEHMDRVGVSGAAHFGASVAVSVNGSAALVGAPNASSGDGEVFPYSYFGLESPYWIDQEPIKSPTTGSNFGASLAMSRGGEYDMIGAPLANGGGGAVYDYRPSGAEQAIFTDPLGEGEGHFGASVALAGTSMDQLLVGAPGDNSGVGAAYDFDAANGGDWLTDGAALTPVPALAAGASYGSSVAVSAEGTSALVGAPGAGSADGLAVSFTGATVPGAPGSVGAVAGAESAAVSWSAPGTTGGSPITSYTVTSSPGSLQCHTSALGCTVLGLTDGQSYTFTVTAANSRGASVASSPSSPVTPQAPAAGAGGGSVGTPTGGGLLGATPPTSGGASLGPPGVTEYAGGGGSGSSAPSPLPPGRLRLLGRTKTSIRLAWTPPRGASGVIGYRVYEYARGRWQLVGTTVANGRSFTRRRLRIRSRHRFAVRAFYAGGRLSAPVMGAWATTR